MTAHQRWGSGVVEVPDPDDRVLSAGGKQLAVGRNVDRPDRRPAALEGLDDLLVGEVPFAHAAIVSGAEKVFAVLCEMDGRCATWMLELRGRLPISGRPHRDRT